MSTYEWITTLLVPVTGIVSWLAARRKRRNDAIADLQRTINMLAEDNSKVYEELVSTRKELNEARGEIDILKGNQEKLMRENAELRSLIEKK